MRSLFVNDYDITTGKRLDDYVRDVRRLLDMGAPLARSRRIAAFPR
jgi:hypothetical protein